MYLKQIRKKKGITQKEIAELLNISQQQVSNIEKGLSELSSKQIIKLCNYLNVTADELLGLKPINEQVNEINKKYNTILNKNELYEIKNTLENISIYIDSLLKKE